MELLETQSTSMCIVDFEARIARLDEEIRLLRAERSSRTGDRLTNSLAEDIAVVGLKEMLTGRRRTIRWIWAILVVVGVLATAYYVYAGVKEYSEDRTVTNVALLRTRTYPYPSLVLCPGSGWVNTEKAYAQGLSKEALRYAIGYLDPFVASDDSSLNITRARREFQNFYDGHNYSSLLEFYRNMTIEPVRVESMSELSTNQGPAAFYCAGCTTSESSAMEKVIVAQLVCYAFAFKPAEARYVESQSTQQLVFQMRSVDNGIIRYTPNWFAHLMSNPRVLQPQYSPMAIEQYTISTLKTSLTNFVTLENDDRKCLKPKEVPKGYSADRCAVRCLHELLANKSGCGVFSYSAYDESASPSHYCNYFESSVPNMGNTSFGEFLDEDEGQVRRSEAGATCVISCPHACDRQIFTATFDTKYPIALDADGWTARARARNLSIVVIQIDHQAIAEDGVMTLTEVSTYSFATLVSNIGGVLGMFVGATVLTFFQVILWAIDYYLDYRSERRKTSIVQDR